LIEQEEAFRVKDEILHSVVYDKYRSCHNYEAVSNLDKHPPCHLIYIV